MTDGTSVNTLTAGELARRWPTLFHMAEAGAWPAIARQGLRSTSALLDLYEIPAGERAAIEAAHRRESVVLKHPEHGQAVIRDNKAIVSTVLRRTLDGITEPDWYRLLNSRVFFWLTQDRLHRLRTTPEYRDRPHDVLHIDTKRLLERYADVVELSPINSGAVHPASTSPRGRDTFTPIASYPRPPGRRAEPAELTVPYAVLDIAELVIAVERV
jgi:hypothetical protein